MINCENCSSSFTPKKPSHRFCSNKCRADHHAHHMPEGTVSGVRKLSNGKISVTIHFEESLALNFEIKDLVTVGSEK